MEFGPRASLLMNMEEPEESPPPYEEPSHKAPPPYEEVVNARPSSDGIGVEASTTPNQPPFCSKRRFCFGIVIVICLFVFFVLGVYFRCITTFFNSSSNPAVAIKFCPQPIEVEAPKDSSSKNVFWNEPIAEHPANISSVEQSHWSGDQFEIGSTKVLYTLKDKDGNTGTCSFTVTVSDVTAPHVNNCPQDIRTDGDTKRKDLSIKVTWIEPTATDNSGKLVTIEKTHHPGSMFKPITTTNVTYIFRDQSANVAVCTFFVTILDAIPPKIYQCPKDMEFVTNHYSGENVEWKEPYAKDNSGHAFVLSQNHEPGSFFFIGSTEVEYVFADARQNVASCSFTVTLTGKLKRSSSSSKPENTTVPPFAGLIVLVILIGCCVMCCKSGNG